MKFKKKAIEDGNTCPLCGAEDSLESVGVANFDGPICTYDVECLACDGEWTETYKLHNLEVRNENINND